ncbi:MAG: DUF4129 domain-containing protein [Theionarchaea archaeon]|nr:DUF4129 domain-containing protein [Theionarchaea archaeon]
MRLWTVLACIVMIAALGHLIFLFEHSGSSSLSPISSDRTRHVVLDYDFFPILCDILIIVIIIGGFKGGVRLRKDPAFPEEEYSWWMLMLVRIAALSLMTAAYVFVLRSPLKTKEFLKIFQGFGDIQSAGEKASHIISQPTSFEHFLIILLSVVIIVIIALLIVSIISPHSPEEPPVLVPFSEFLHRKRNYTFDGPPRDIIIDAYGAALDSLRIREIHIPEHYTPWEVQEKINNPHFTTLTRLFEKARYSLHPITHHDSSQALHTLEMLKKEDIHIPEDQIKEPS